MRARSYAETMHPGIGPEAEAEALYVRQTGLLDRLSAHAGEFVIWDVGLGAAANALAVLRQTGRVRCTLRVLSFDLTAEPLAFAVRNADKLPYLAREQEVVSALLQARRVRLERGQQVVDWTLCLGDFPSLLVSKTAGEWPSPHLILFDPFSPARNPAMWTLAVFESLFRRLDPGRPCLLATYTRSSMIRVSLLLAGFWVGAGLATGSKEETTVASNRRELLSAPLDRRWLERARRSDSAQPLREPTYLKAPLRPETWEQLMAHPQFVG